LVYVLFGDLGVSVIGDNITEEELVHDLWQCRGGTRGKALAMRALTVQTW
jgi:hypothetical protein